MGQMIDGEWHRQPLVTDRKDGRFVRPTTSFRNWITKDGEAGPTGKGGFKAEAGRYHIYVSYACPWAHRTLIFRKLKKLESAITASTVDWFMDDDGWYFSSRDGATPDPINGAERMWEVYRAADKQFTGRVTVPVLWDREQSTIVNNESAEIIRMLNSAFDDVSASGQDYYPAALAGRIEEVNERIYHTVNNGVYKCGFARSQSAYDESFKELFDSLDWAEEILATSRYIAGDAITEADWRFFTTLIRFDAVYFTHFKCNLRRIDDYENLSNYLRELYQMPGIAETVNLHHIRNHYYQSHESINPARIVPGGPILDFDRPHNRHRLKAA